jgi:Ca2+-transporting ATPase
VALTFVLQMLTIYVPFLHPVFKTQTLTLSELLIAMAIASVSFWGIELEKLIKRRLDRRAAVSVASA